MAIGEIRLGDTAQQYSNRKRVAGEFGEGIADGITSIAKALGKSARDQEEIDKKLRTRQEKRTRMSAAVRYQRFKGEEARRIEEMRREADVRGVDLQKEVRESARARWQEFRATIPQEVQHEWDEKHESWMQGQENSAFEYAFALENADDRRMIEEVANEIAAEVYNGTEDYDTAVQFATDIIEDSGLTDADKEILRENLDDMLTGARFQGAVRISLEQNQVLATMTPAQQRLAATIAADESNGQFNVRFGGRGGDKTFDDYSRHPQIYEEIHFGPFKGQKSSAAGAFQFTYETWEVARKALDLPDFSPSSQIRAMLWLAELRYDKKKPLGLTFQEVLNSDDPQQLLSIKRVLAPTWQAFTTMTNDRFLSLITGQTQVGFNETAPNIWDDERFDTLPFTERMKLHDQAQRDFSQQQAEIARQQKEAAEAMLNAERMKARAGLSDERDLARGLAEGWLNKPEHIDQFRKDLAHGREVVLAERQVASVLSTGEGTLVKNQHEDALNRVLSPAVGRLQQGDETVLTDTLLPVVRQAGFIPSQTAQTLISQAQGADPRMREFAYEALAELYAVDPQILARSDGFSKSMIENVEFMADSHKYYSSPQEAMKQLDWVRDPANREIVKQRREDAADVLKENWSPESIKKEVFHSWINVPGGEPSLPFDSQQTAALQVDWNRAYKHGYTLHGTDEGAAAFAGKQIVKTWGVSEIGGGGPLIMRLPATMYYDNEEMIDFQIREYLVENGLPGDTRYVLQANKQTQEIGEAWQVNPAAAGSNAPYDVLFQTTEGLFVPLPGTDGGAWSFDGGLDLPPGMDPNKAMPKQWPDHLQTVLDERVQEQNSRAKAAALQTQRSDLEDEVVRINALPRTDDAVERQKRRDQQAELEAQAAALSEQIAREQATAEALKESHLARMGVERTVAQNLTKAELSAMSKDELWTRISKMQRELGGGIEAMNDPVYRELMEVWMHKEEDE